MLAVLALAEKCKYDREHAHQVAKLALRLFDELSPLHGSDDAARFHLHCAALLHDIGRVEGSKAHHRTSLRLIVNALDLPLDDRERLIVGSIARYHRRTPPDPKHNNFAALTTEQQHEVSLLSGMLRIADGLDHSHKCAIEDLTCDITPDQITISSTASIPIERDCRKARSKSQLLADVLGRRVAIQS